MYNDRTYNGKQKVKKMEMTNDRERLLAKIKKLLNMAKHNASNETEAATALRQAEAMMRKHDIQFAEIEAKELNPSDMAMEGTGEETETEVASNLLSSMEGICCSMRPRHCAAGPLVTVPKSSACDLECWWLSLFCLLT